MALSVVYAVDTCHVLGAVALTGASASNDAAELVGPALPLRVSLGADGTATLPVDARELAVAAVDDEPGALAEPLAYAVEFGSDEKPKPKLLHLPSWNNELKLTTDKLTVTVPFDTTAPTPVVALVSDHQATHVLAGEIPAGGTEAKLAVSLAADTAYGVLVLVVGWAGRLERVKVA
ncbi:hypothetical protein [Streptomyces pseudovenezuelae]|uniref:DUF4397 domain-containing protein n=1 Tax=Streptomyces pseudovenezuelae TaxID=67350 RepID=A0ABT6LBU6_9ACTN|nr:hypothetical protein [Streptomyces pseudovenezuelae]MDH6213445.1 hypothetical protein [Streptomyces pseudovenezuelae]